MKILAVGVELFCAEGQTDRDMTKLIISFRNFAIAPNITHKDNRELQRKVSGQNKQAALMLLLVSTK